MSDAVRPFVCPPSVGGSWWIWIIIAVLFFLFFCGSGFGPGPC